MTTSPSAIPFTVISGFLGSGKSTLVNHILEHTGQEVAQTRFAVLVNDFGRINIDQSLIAKHDGETLELSNGCICCSLVNGFMATMFGVMERKEQIDHIIVEASGIAHPSRIMDFAHLDPELLADAIITLVDAEQALDHLSNRLIRDTLLDQITAADVLAVNKIDLRPDPQRLIAQLTELNPKALLLQATHAEFPLEVILAHESINARLAITAAPEPAEAHQHEGGQHHSLEHPFTSISWISKQPIDKGRFTALVETIPGSILRGKGVLHSYEGLYKWHLCGKRSAFYPLALPIDQQALDRSTAEYGPNTAKTESTARGTLARTQMVFIGTSAADLAHLKAHLARLEA